MKSFNKKLLNSTFIFFIISSCLFTSCIKSDFSLRVNNQYPDTLINVMAGPANFGTIAPGQVTGYINIPEGNSTLSGQDKNNPSLHLTGNVSTTGIGKHRWTMTITSTGTTSIALDN